MERQFQDRRRNHQQNQLRKQRQTQQNYQYQSVEDAEHSSSIAALNRQFQNLPKIHPAEHRKDDLTTMLTQNKYAAYAPITEKVS